jgi:ABC-2 type transport system ATP-binding protein
VRIRGRFNVDVNVVGTQVRIEKDQAHRFVTDVVEAFPGEIDAVSIAKPSLEDVFIKRTGHRFWTEGPPITEGAPKSKARKH